MSAAQLRSTSGRRRKCLRASWPPYSPKSSPPQQAGQSRTSPPEDLAAKVGTTTRCKLTAEDGSTLGVTVKVSSVEGEQINFDFKAGDTASPAAH
ncbi:DUF4333 domain-containing protein [Streptomyces sp. enrichment culture]|uniref:DUF4333 domain-containing protein n=1 Tax=Streptomyces sp. enrichment culture TaxID=1795815 RepID=UPI003F580183